MRLDHVSYAAGPDGLDGTARALADRLGAELVDGGIHPRFGTRNRVLPLADGHYLEVVGVLDHPAADDVPFGQAVRARSETGGGWLGWVVAVDDLAPVETRLGRAAVQGNRKRPDGFELLWKQIGVKGLMNDPQLPFFVHWESDRAEHPSKGADDVRLVSIEIAGDPHRVSDWLGEPESHPLDDVDVEWVAPSGPPGVMSVTFRTAEGLVRV
ncbi:glyoxalase-like protein [Haloactinopolyspora alba]|uniref:Glyoxalase-like protein n=1 Tax=Haloactinopolyspora alba TaxID=648780 RepID=A0A2P8EFY0_9ACTN|nr:VOC family protein [Haloactinopolyspora alba]PSL08373.1 glyoxalase-like protein [Haloactinopolyspora alba]